MDPDVKIIPSSLCTLYLLSTVSMSSFFHEGDHANRLAIQGLIFLIASFICFAKSYKTLTSSIFIVISLGLFAFNSRSPFVIHLAFNIMIATYVLYSGSIEKSLMEIWKGSLFGLVVVLAMCAAGLADNTVIYVYTSDTVKNSLGFFNPNVPGMICAGLLIISMITKSRPQIILSAALFVAVIYLSQSRSSIGFVAIFLISRLILFKFDISAKRIFCTSVYFMGCLISLSLIYIATESPVDVIDKTQWIDDILSKRLYFAIPEITAHGSAFPGTPSKNLDFAWANIMIIFGGIAACAYFALMATISLIIDEEYSDIFYLSTSVMFASLFTENISYIYYSLGIIFALPTAIAIKNARKDISGRIRFTSTDLS